MNNSNEYIDKDDEYISAEDISNMNRKMYNESILSGKIHGSLEDPLSQVFYDISDVISPGLKSLGITPNFITTVRFLMILGPFPYFFYNKMYNMAAITYMVAYFGDCLDGHLSRKYNLDTEFGDYYDHVADTVTAILTLYIVCTSLSSENQWIIGIIIFTLLLSLVQLGCQERYLKIIGTEIESRAMSALGCMCPESMINDDEIEETMEYTKLMGVGTYQLFFTILIWHFKHLE